MEPKSGHHEADHSHAHVHAHEKTDANVHSAGILGGAFVILLVFGLVTGYLAFRFFNAPETSGPPASTISTARPVPTGPRLQVNAHEDLLDYLEHQQQTLDSYGWVDKKAGVAHVPIEHAMEAVLKNGLPVRGAEPADKAQANAPKPAAKTPAVPGAGQSGQ